MPAISLVLFDMHDVLCRYDKAKRLTDLERLSGKTASEIDRDIWQSGFEGEADAGKFDDAAYLSGFGLRLGYPISLQEWLENRKASTTPMPEVLALMAAVKRHARIAVLTNNHFLVRAHLNFLFPEVFALCGADSYVSAQFGAAKPDPAAYRACLQTMGEEPMQSLFIDDSKANVQGADAAGLQTHLFTGAGALEEDLRQRGLL